MKSLKKISIYGVLGTSSLLLAACGGTGDDAEAPTNADGNIIMTVGQQTAGNPKFPAGDSYSDNAYRRVIQEELGVELESLFEAEGEDYNLQVSLAITSGEIPDMMVVGREEVEELYDNGMIADLTEVFEEHASDHIKEMYATYDNMQLEAATFDGQLMAIPGTSDDFGPNLVWIRQDYLDILDIELDPDGNRAITLEELEETAQAFLDNDPGETGNPRGLAFPHWLTSGNHGGSGYTATAIFNAFGSFPGNWLIDENGTVYNGNTTEETKEALEYINGLYEKGLLDQQFGTRTYDEINAMMVNGELGIVPGPWHMSDWGLLQAQATHAEGKFVPYAIENASGDGRVNAISRPSVGGYVVVREGFQHPEKVIEMINLIFDDIPNSDDMETEFPELYEYSQLQVDGTARPFNIVLFNSLTEIDTAVLASKAADGEINIEDIDDFNTRNNAELIRRYKDDPENAEPVEWAMYASRYLAVNGVMNTLREDNLLDETTPPTIVETISAEERNGAQIGTLTETTFINFVTGEESLDNFDNYVEEWNSQGGEAILEERQKIIDEREE